MTECLECVDMSGCGFDVLQTWKLSTAVLYLFDSELCWLLQLNTSSSAH